MTRQAFGETRTRRRPIARRSPRKSPFARGARGKRRTKCVSPMAARRCVQKELSLTDKTFAELGVAQPLLQALAAEDYHTPTPIQARAIPALLAGKDMLGIAQTGTGKTAAFALPLLQHLAASRQAAGPRRARALVLAPTRELAIQIHDSFKTYGRHLNLRHTVVFGGVGQQPQVKAMAKGVDTLVATPGRLLDLMQQGHILLDRVAYLVLDEADRMLDKGGIAAAAIHGNKSQQARQRALEGFRAGHARVLVATDIAARGIDVDGVTHVINYELPHEPESYVHRIGRTARAGAAGVAISLCDADERGQLRAIERLIRRPLPVEKPRGGSSGGPR